MSNSSDNNVAIAEVKVSYNESVKKILLIDIFLPLLITCVIAFLFWRFLGPLLFKGLYSDFRLNNKPSLYAFFRAFCYDYFVYVGVFLGFLIFGIVSFQQEFPPGPGRLLKVLIRHFKKRSELRVDKSFEDLGHPKPFDFKSAKAISFSKLLRGELKPSSKAPWKEPWTIDPNSIVIGNLNAFSGDRHNRFRHVVLETGGRNLHTAIIGASGSGKTVSYIGPLLALDSLNPSVGTFTINPKGDLKLKRFAFAGIHKHFRETGEFVNRIQVLSFNDKSKSLMYDPFLFGTEIDSSLNIQNKICGSFVFEVEYYKTMAQNFVAKFASIMESEPKLRYRLTLRHLVYYMENPSHISYLAQYVENSTNKQKLSALQKYNPETILGIQSHLATFVDNNDLLHIFDDFSRPCLNLVDTLQDSGNVFIEVDTISKGGVSKSFGKMLIRDLQVMASKRDSGAMPSNNRIAVNLDEFGSFAYPDFIDFLDKGRSSGFMIALAFQDLANLQKDGLPMSFQNEVLGNTSNKFFFKLADNKVSEYGSDFLGSRYANTETVSYSSSANTLADSQQGSSGVRYQKELLPYVLPSELQTLKLGQCYVKLMTANHGPIAGAASIGLMPDDGMPNAQEVDFYMQKSFAASLKHPGWDQLLPVTNDFDPYGNLRNRKIQEPVTTSSPNAEASETISSPLPAEVNNVPDLASQPEPSKSISPNKHSPDISEDLNQDANPFSDFLMSESNPDD